LITRTLTSILSEIGLHSAKANRPNHDGIGIDRIFLAHVPLDTPATTRLHDSIIQTGN
jgi:hypothetical protein